MFYQGYQPPQQPYQPPVPPQPPIDMEGLKVSAARKKLCRIGLALVVYLVLTSVVQLGLMYLPFLQKLPYFEVLSQLASYAAGIPVFFAIVGSMPKEKPTRQKLGMVNWISFLAVSFLLMTIGSQIASTLMEVIESLREAEISNAIADQINAYSPLENFIIVVIMAPIAEEFLCRKLIIDRLLPYSQWIAVVTSGVFFGLIHGNFYQFFYAALLGILFGIVYVKTGKLIHTILMHMIINFFGSVISTAYSDLLYQMPESSTSLNPWTLIIGLYSLSMLALAGCGVVFAIHHLRKGSLDKTGSAELPLKRQIHAAWINWGTFLLLGFCTLLFAASLFI